MGKKSSVTDQRAAPASRVTKPGAGTGVKSKDQDNVLSSKVLQLINEKGILKAGLKPMPF